MSAEDQLNQGQQFQRPEYTGPVEPEDYWHLTNKPKFKPSRKAGGYEALGLGKKTENLYATTHPAGWVQHQYTASRRYAAELDVSRVAPEDIHRTPVNTEIPPQHVIKTPEMVGVKQMLPIKEAEAEWGRRAAVHRQARKEWDVTPEGQEYNRRWKEWYDNVYSKRFR